MQYFKISPGRFIEYDEISERAKIIVVDELKQQKKDLQARIAEADPNQPKTNQEWIEWAKANYKYVSHDEEKRLLGEIDAVLDAVRSL